MSTLLAALAGGAVGVLLTWAARLTSVGREIQANDRALRRLEAHLERWVCDETVELRRELDRVRNELNAGNLFYSGEHTHRVALTKERFLQRYRDQETTTLAHAEDVVAREGVVHAFWRRWRYPSLRPEFELPPAIASILDYWALPETRHLTPTDVPSQIDDPRKRSTERTLQEINARDWE